LSLGDKARLGVNGFIYLSKLAAKIKSIAGYFRLIEYLKLRTGSSNQRKERERFGVQQTLVLQTQINEKQETLRGGCFSSRKRSGRSHYDERTFILYHPSIYLDLIETDI
jgi:hypothetical protein